MAETKMKQSPRPPMFPDADFGADEIKTIALYVYTDREDGNGKKLRRSIGISDMKLKKLDPFTTDEAMLQEAYKDTPEREYYVEARSHESRTLGGRNIVLGKGAADSGDDDDDDDEDDDEDDDDDKADEIKALKAEIEALKIHLDKPPSNPLKDAMELIEFQRKMSPPPNQNDTLKTAADISAVMDGPQRQAIDRLTNDLAHERTTHQAEIARLNRVAEDASRAHGLELSAAIRKSATDVDDERKRLASTHDREIVEYRKRSDALEVALAKARDDASASLERMRVEKGTEIDTLRQQLRSEQSKYDTDTSRLRNEVDTARRDGSTTLQNTMLTNMSTSISERSAHQQEINAVRFEYETRIRTLANENTKLAAENVRMFSKAELDAKAKESADEATRKASGVMASLAAGVGPALGPLATGVLDAIKSSNAAMQAQVNAQNDANARAQAAEYQRQQLQAQAQAHQAQQAPAPTPAPATQPEIGVRDMNAAAAATNANSSPVTEPSVVDIPEFECGPAETVSTGPAETTPATAPAPDESASSAVA